MENKDIILGAGISGLGAGYKLGDKAQIFEMRDRIGGLCDNFLINGFRFDYAVHLSFTKNPQVRAIFDKVDFLTHKPDALNFSKGLWLKHPLQNNLNNLPIQERIQIIKGFINREDKIDINNYGDWLQSKYGKYFSENYPEKYTKKYWCTEAYELSTTWVANRMYQPSIDEILFGAMTDETPNTYYAKEMRYPLNGGYKAFFEHIAEGQRIFLKHKAMFIDPIRKMVKFENGKSAQYRRLISSVPLPEVINMLDNVPLTVLDASRKLKASSMVLASVGFNEQVKIPSLWFYVYDEEIPFARAYSPSMKSPNNVPEGKCSLQFEFYFKNDEIHSFSDVWFKQQVILALNGMGIAMESQIEFIDIRTVPYGNVIFDLGMEQQRAIVRNYLDSIGIITIGRFGEWDYLWSDQSLLSGLNVSEEI
ncbi:MAG: NAD(P)-binding protein [Peptostreptococcaceae bacterium]|nr:NAD(P)-binding protein [Peptostreptococcaceae bacterium]